MDTTQHDFLPHTLVIGNRRIWVRDLHDASAAYQDVREESGEGVSTFPEGMVYAGEAPVARVSYNGRVWAPKPWANGDQPLLEAS